MEMIGDFFTVAFTTAWLWLSIPVCIFLFFYTIHSLIIASRKATMKTWRINDVINIKNNPGDNWAYNKAKGTSSSGEPRALLKKWDKYESLIEFKNGDQCFIRSKKIDNREAYNRERESGMDEFMEDNNGIKTKAERREDAIDSVIGETEETK